jgi:type VI secretion system protein ImpG
MDQRLLDYYNEELRNMRELAGAFAQQYPRVAGRLGAQAPENADPYVKLLIESFCMMAARTQIKLDAEFPKFAGRLLEVFCPTHAAPMPSIAVARLFPRLVESDATNGFVVPRGTGFSSRVALGETTACRYHSAQDVVLYPLEIRDARLTSFPLDVAGLDRYVSPARPVRGALRIRLRTTNGMPIARLRGLDRLPVYLAGDEQIASRLFELLHAASVALLTGEPGSFHAPDRSVSVVNCHPVVHEGLEPDRGLLPLGWSKFHGHNLLREYFACPSRFLFFTLTGLRDGFSRIRGREVEIIVLLDQPPERLASLVDASRFALFCTPVINLYASRTDQLEISAGSTDTLMVPSRVDPLDHEVFSIERIVAQDTPASKGLEFRPLFETLNNDGGNYGRYFAIRREPRLTSSAARINGTRTSYTGSEVFVSLVDQNDAPFGGNLRYLTADVWLTNRDLPLLVPRNGRDDLEGADEDVVESVGLVRPPSAPRPPFGEREASWRLIRQLNFNHLAFTQMDHRDGGKGLRDFVRLHLSAGDAQGQREVDGLIGMKTRSVERMLPGEGPLVFGRGAECALTVDEAGFSGASPYLLGVILERFLAGHASINAFVQTELHSMQRGLIARWPVRMGMRDGSH